MLDETKLSNMVLDLKKLEMSMDENTDTLEYNKLVNEIISYLKEVL